MFGDDLKAKGWTEITDGWEYAKGDWKIEFDTGHWMIVSTAHNPRVFCVPAPQEIDAKWTVNLIEHLCSMDDERYRLRSALVQIQNTGGNTQDARALAANALNDCYHAWLVNTGVPDGQLGRLYCTICGRKISSEKSI
jgi:hypothetical protein